nr:Dihydrofolate reductase [uncultured bacterium]
MTISLVVAASENNVIGKNNGLPWTLPDDMKFFKNTTWGLPVIMGRKTFESMDNKALPGRINIIITRQKDYKAKDCVVVQSWNDAMFVAQETDCNEICVIGGGEIFKETITKADIIYLTRVHTVVDGDVFFPEIDEKKWKKASSREHAADEKHNFAFTFEKWERV